MSKVILYIATSLDGFIARPDGNIDWLNSIPNPEVGDYGYSELLSTIGSTIMGRKTYEEVMGFGVEWPYTGLDSYIMTSDENLKIQSPDTYIFTDNIKDLIVEIRKKSTRDIWLIGGGQLVTAFLNEGLIDKMIISIIPKIIGEGIPLFAGTPLESHWKLLKSEPYDTGVVNLTYEKS